jgi:hypothetical protein
MSYAQLRGTFLCITNPFAVGLNPRDLHALSTPPAFILSQDQTLNKDEWSEIFVESDRMTGPHKAAHTHPAIPKLF